MEELKWSYTVDEEQENWHFLRKSDIFYPKMWLQEWKLSELLICPSFLYFSIHPYSVPNIKTFPLGTVFFILVYDKVRLPQSLPFFRGSEVVIGGQEILSVLGMTWGKDSAAAEHLSLPLALAQAGGPGGS